MILTLLSLLAGLLLGQHFKVAALIPAMAVDVLAAVGMGLAHADTIGWIVLIAVAGTIALQVGYLAGTVVSAIVTPATTFSRLASHRARGSLKGQ